MMDTKTKNLYFLAVLRIRVRVISGRRIWIRIYIKVKGLIRVKAHFGAVKDHNGAMEAHFISIYI